MPVAHTDWIDIAYAEHGDPAGQPVLLLHGFPDAADTWDGVVRESRSEKLRLIVPDLRGYGHTTINRPDAGGGMEAAMGQERWFAAGHHRHEVPDVGHFVQRESPRVVANLVRRAAGV